MEEMGSEVTGSIGSNDGGESLERADDLLPLVGLEVLHLQCVHVPHLDY